MELNEKQKKALDKGWNMGGMPSGSSSNSFAAVKGVNLRWTNAVIPYEIDCSLGRFLQPLLFYKNKHIL